MLAVDRPEGTLHLFDYLRLTASRDRFMKWMDAWAQMYVSESELALGGWQIDDISYTLGFSQRLVGEASIRVWLYVTPEDTTNIILEGVAPNPLSVLLFFRVRDAIRNTFDLVPAPVGEGPGRPPLASRQERLLIVRNWHRAKASGVTKRAFAASVVLPGQGVGISPRTLTYWEQEYADLFDNEA